MKRLTMALVVSLTVLVAPAPALADERDKPTRSERIKISGSQFKNARDDAKAERKLGREKDAKKATRENFVRKSAEKAGLFYVSADVDVVEPTEGVVVAVPADMQVSELTIEETDGKFSAELRVDAGPNGGQEGPAGMGMQPYFGSGASGTYLIEFWAGSRKLAEMLSNWQQKQLLSDGNDTYDWWGYTRKAWGQSFEIPGRNWSVTGMYLWNFPDESVKPNLVAWEDMAPGADLRGNCDNSPYNALAAAGAPAATISVAFKDCDYNDMWFHSQVPGEYSIRFDQGAVFSQGNYETGYAVTVKSIQDSSVWYNDVQRLEIAKYTYPAKKCQAPTNGGADCQV